MTENSAFLHALYRVDLTYATDRAAARACFLEALRLATPEEWKVLDALTEHFTVYPYRQALGRLRALWHDDPASDALAQRLLPPADPGLYPEDRADLVDRLERRAVLNNTSLEEEYAQLHTQLQVAELPRQSIRAWRNPPARLYAAPQEPTDLPYRMAPDQIAYRVRLRAKRRPAVVEPAVVTGYVRDSLYADTMAREIAAARARRDRLIAKGLLADPAPLEWRLRFPGDKPPLPAGYARRMWDFQYVAYVAEQHQHAYAMAGRSPISEERALDFAGEHTTLRDSTDHRPGVPYQGNALDDDREAMIEVSGWRCVSCFIERAVVDQARVHAHHGPARSDDGLCDTCREDGSPALPALPVGFTGADLARTYCRFLIEHPGVHPDSARAILTEAHRRAPRWLASIIGGFLGQPDLPGAPAALVPEPGDAPARPKRSRGPVAGAGQHISRCDGCTRFRAVQDDQLCTECRVHLGIPVPARRAA
ncbi:hypothetical protein IU500_18825 [Nocardia terpenica]|uniref:hypothetical protein n=1 Tax=Nocardia terpenica TaxID=455432 RepID=UPI001893B552|nr:hypothetical protein [Nocardia terpenica]MBF6063541.1 hypothetical protein [Nocardia terpenica]MBF6106097.1 hypothetical protein [Nocardia terpenica]MBF6113318.1 hypothetical protein [Nocardia terpenica]MBF6119838.1 hypothetical protein [Nocardia terpenica]MBF6152249.1 hypothetical protein [Nocardia terpenica]